MWEWCPGIKCHHELMGLPDYDRQVIRNTYQILDELIDGSIHQ